MTTALALLVRSEPVDEVVPSPRDAVRAFERSAAVGRKSLPDRLKIRQHQVGRGVDEDELVFGTNVRPAGILIARGATKSVYLDTEEKQLHSQQSRRFPSSSLVSFVRTGCKEWLTSYAVLHGLSVDDLVGEMPREEQTKLEISQGVRAALSAIGSIARQCGRSECTVGRDTKFEPTFAALLQRYLPAMSIHIFQAIERPLYIELCLKAQQEEFVVNAAHLVFQDHELVVKVRAWQAKKLGPPPGEEVSRAFPI